MSKKPGKSVKKKINKKASPKKVVDTRKILVSKRLEYFSENKIQDIFEEYNSDFDGIVEDAIENSRDEYGANIIIKEKKTPLIKKLAQAFINPFTAILFILAFVSFITDVIIAKPGEKDPTTVIIIAVMVLISGMLRFIQESRSNKAAEKLAKMVETTTCVVRNGIREEIPLDEVVVGDIIQIAAGDIIPADVRIINSKDLFLSQSSLTGEAEPLEKFGGAIESKKYDSVLDRKNLAFMGSTIISGSATAIVAATGNDTVLGSVAKAISVKPEKTSFEKGVNSVSWVLIRFMLIMVPVVFFINGLTKGNWLDAFLFAISIAVGLTPEMLPMIVTTCLAKGAYKMAKKKTIIKNLNSIQNFGAIDVLCTDKTGTLTQDKVILEQHLDVNGNSDSRVLRHAFLNSYFQTGLKNLMDLSIIEKTQILKEEFVQLKSLEELYEKVDEIPFDFARRRMSVVVRDRNNKTQLITKGAVEEILSICNFVEYNGKVEELTFELKKKVQQTAYKLNDDGMRVIAVAQKTNPSPVGAFSVKDESEMVLIGYLSFLDPPKETAHDAISALKNHGVDVKILTGDSDRVTVNVCKQVGIQIKKLLLGTDIEDLSDEELKVCVEETNVFAKLSPEQKARIVKALRYNGHVVGYMGDGINDAVALKAADVGISVDSAVDIAKESAHIILLEKDLMILEEGIIEGRKVYANMIKYIKMTASSNFGNMFSVLIASAALPFLPMLPVQLIFLNLVYDISCTTIPWDNVDKQYLAEPKKWDPSGLSKFMLWIGPTSSVFDIATYLLMFFYICPKYCGGTWNSVDVDKEMFIAMFQAGWFIESMWTQTLVVHMIRTPKVPFVQSRASASVISVGSAAILLLTIIPFIPLGGYLGFVALPFEFFGWLILTVVLYMILVTLIKMLYIKRYNTLL